LFRRDYERYQIKGSASLVTEEKVKPLKLKDLSARGFGFISEYPLEINKDVKIILNIPRFFNNSVLRQAKVIWCQRINKNLWRGGLDFGMDNKLVLSAG
jgi:hypothetical protein